MAKRINNKIRIAIVDDHPLSRMGTQAMLSGNSEFQILSMLNSGPEALEFLTSKQVDVMVVDVLMPEMDGFELLRAVKEEYPRVKVVMLTISDEREAIIQAMAYDADGFLLKDTDRNEMKSAINIVYNGARYYCDKMLHKVVPDFINFAKVMYTVPTKFSDYNMAKSLSKAKNPRETLTAREIEILKMIGMKNSTKEIANKFDISAFTVSTHRKNIATKLGITDLAMMVKLGRKLAIEDGDIAE